MNRSAPEGPEPEVGRSDGAALRFARWLLEPPAGPQPTASRVLRLLLRAVGWIVYAALVGPDDGHGGMAGGRGRPKR